MKKYLLLLIPPILASIIDLGMTIYGQPADYWKDSATINEASKSFRFALSLGPVAFLGTGVIMILLISSIVFFLDGVFSAAIASAFTIGSVCGASSWVRYNLHKFDSPIISPDHWYQVVVLFNGFAGIILAIALSRFIQDESPHPIKALPRKVRFSIAIILAIIGAAFYLNPRA